jgi:hypothetical protein
MPFLCISFNILPIIRSYPDALFGLTSFCIIFWISSGVRNLTGCIICNGSFSALLIYVSRSSFCGSWFGLNVFSKCPTKVFAFYLVGPSSGPCSWLCRTIKKNSAMTAGVLAQIWTKHLPIKYLERYRYTNVLSRGKIF